MAKFMLDGQEYCGGGGSNQIVKLTQAEYDALSDEKLSNNTIYLITDSGELTAENLFYDDTKTGLGVNNVQDAIVEQNKKKVGYATLNPSDTSVTTTEKTVSVLDGRKFSDYYLITVALIVGAYIRASMTVPLSMLKDKSISLSYVDGGNNQRWVDITYVSDTSYIVKAKDGFDTPPYLKVIGHRLES